MNPKLDNSFFTCKGENISAKRSLFDQTSNIRITDQASNQRDKSSISITKDSHFEAEKIENF